MKRLFLLAIVLTISLNLFAQKDVTRFLGIPVDGSKEEMIKELEKKGFVISLKDNRVMEGEFNGSDVYVQVGTTKNKVSRIMVSDAQTFGSTEIRIRFNNLCYQFENNPNYVSFDDYTIPADEKVSYEITVNDKSYQAVFYQKPEIMDSTEFKKNIRETLLKKYSEEELKNPTEEIAKDIFVTACMYDMDVAINKKVWFTIFEFYGEYYISIYYDNEYNRANGEDL